MHIDLEQLDLELGLDVDPLDDDDLLGELADSLGVDTAGLAELESFIGISGLVIVRQDDRPDRVTAVRKCLDCNEPARPRKSPNGPWPKRCEEHTKTRQRYMVNGGSKARAAYRLCCVQWQLDGNPDHRGLCQQCRDARKSSRTVSQCEASWLAGKLGPAGWHVEKAGWQPE
jgi:hypothetical protein